MSHRNFTLLFLPREIRLIIYEHLFHDTYFRKWPITFPITPSQSLNILQTCRTINDEASPTLYTGSTFHFQFFANSLPYQAALPDSLFKRVTKVAISTTDRWGTTCGAYLFEYLASLISQFSGCAIPRSTFHIWLNPSNKSIQKAGSEVIQALSTLSGFRSVLLIFEAELTGWGPRPPMRARAQDPTGMVSLGWSAQQMDKRREFYEDTVGKFVHRLELGLGDGEVREYGAQGEMFARCVEFRPRA